MSRWFRWHEGTCEDGKFRVVARNAGVTVATVMGVWAVILEDASHDDHRGIAVRGEDFYAAILDLGGELQIILEAMQRIGLICCTNDTIEVSNWSKRQYETDTVDGTNAERQRRFREKHRSNAPQTKRNGSVTAAKRPETEAETEADTEKKECAVAPLDPSVPEREYFVRGREVLGKGAGGLIGKLLKAKGGNVAMARAAIEQASQKQSPTEYVAAICRGPIAAKPLTAHQQERETGRKILDALRDASSRTNSEFQRHDPGNGPASLRGGVRGALVDLSATRDREGYEPVERASRDGQLSELGKVSGSS